MMRLEVHEYLRVSATLSGLASDAGALTRVEREAILSFVQEVERKFLPPRQQDDVPFAAPCSRPPCSTDPLRAHIHEAIFQQTGEYPNSSLFE